MEQSVSSKIDIKSLLCDANKPARYLCVTGSCRMCSLSCGQAQCLACDKNHADCDFTNLQRLVDRVLTKKNGLSQPLNKAFSALEKMYNDAIELISIERDNLFLVKENYGLTARQVQFLEFLNANNREELTGDFILYVKEASKDPVRETNLCEQEVVEFWKKEKSQLQKFLKSVSNLVNYQFGKFIRMEEDFSWDASNKPVNMAINQNIIEQNQLFSQMRFALMNTKLKPSKQYTWALRIAKLSSWIGMGICLRNKISSEKEFKFPDSGLGHGTFMISFNGYSWSHDNLSQNNSPKSFSLTTGDIVYMKYDPKNRHLLFVKNNNQARYQLIVSSQPSGDQYAPCVNLLTAGDSVEIVEVSADVKWQDA